MIQIFSDPQELVLNEIVQSAFERSCGIGSTHLGSNQDFINTTITCSKKSEESRNKFTILIFINPTEEVASLIIDSLKSKNEKMIVFGKLPVFLANFLGASVVSVSRRVKLAASCEPAKTHQYSESDGVIVYKRDLDFGIGNQRLPSRALKHFDFNDEWNNLGFGAVTTDDSIWAISQEANIPNNNIVAKLVSKNVNLSAYCGLWNFPKSSLLWFNRAVGPVDSYEWYLVEQYIAKYLFSKLPAWPVILEIPFGYESAVTMRLDCDEDIESARPLGDAYQELHIPFSLALHATVLSNSTQHKYPNDVIRAGGAILSHTLTHAPNWGGSKEAARREAEESATVIQKIIGVRPSFGVSPFHHTPDYARQGLSDAGYLGVIGGIISNDPDFVMARAGRPPKSKDGFIGHTQQCMFHGDCLLKEGDPLIIYKRAYEQAKISKTLFAYLDHPFSQRYQYGWSSEAERIKVHIDFINYIKKTSNNTIFLNQNEALHFLTLKSHVKIEELNGKLNITIPRSSNKRFNVAIQFGNNKYQLTDDCMTL